MQLVFQNPLWLVAALIGVPLLAHLFSRSRPRRREFPSLRLLREAMRQVTRVRQPRDRWLLILRTLAMTALAMAFLQPWLLSRFGARNGSARTVVLVIDRTASMGFADGTRTRFAQATSAAEDVLGALPVNSKANIVWLRAHPVGELPEPGPNLDFIRQALRQATVVPEAGDIVGAMSLARRQLAEAQGDRELVVISDFQKSAWKDAEWTDQPGIRVTRIATGRDDAANIAVAGLTVEPSRPVIGAPAQLSCRVRNFSAEPHRVTVFGEAGESRVSTTVEVAAWSETVALMPVTFPQEGAVPLKASVSEDRFPGDDVCYALADVRRALRVGVVGGQENVTANTWLRAARALDGVAVDGLNWADVEGGRIVDVLLVAAWDGGHGAALLEHLKHGSLVLQPVASGQASDAALKMGLGDAALTAQERETPGWGLRVLAEDHPLFALFTSGGYGDPFSARFRKRVGLALNSSAKPLLAFDDGGAALALAEVNVAGQRPATVLWWNLDLGGTDWPTRVVFPSFIGELVQFMGKRAIGSSRVPVEPGDLMRFDAGAAFTMADVSLLDERDKARKLATESPRTPNRLVSTQPAEPGNFRWMAQGSVLDRTVVSFPERESDLRLLSESDLGRAGGTVISDSARLRLSDLRNGNPIWPWCLAAAALFFLGEGLCLRIFNNAREAATPVTGVATAPKRELAEVNA